MSKYDYDDPDPDWEDAGNNDDLICANATDEVHVESDDDPHKCSLCGEDIPADRCPECGKGVVVDAGPMEWETGHQPYACNAGCSYRG